MMLPPPSNWQDFELLCRDLYERLWNDPETQLHGRTGQAQQGVDVFGRPGRGTEWAGVQCKLKGPLAAALSSVDIEQEVKRAQMFRPRLTSFTIATTAFRDTTVQAAARKITVEQLTQKSFSVSVVFWEDILAQLGSFPDLVAKHYPASIGRGNSPDQQIEISGSGHMIVIGNDTHLAGFQADELARQVFPEAAQDLSASGPTTPKVFISYSHKDAAWKDRVLEQLRVLEFMGELMVWDDQRINAGSEWLPEIEMAMKSAKVAVLLISTDFLTSVFIRRTEIPRLLTRRQSEGLRVIPVLVRPCPWAAVGWLATLQGRPKNGKALSELKKHQVEKNLAALALEIRDFLGQREPLDWAHFLEKTQKNSESVQAETLRRDAIAERGLELGSRAWLFVSVKTAPKNSTLAAGYDIEVTNRGKTPAVEAEIWYQISNMENPEIPDEILPSANQRHEAGIVIGPNATHVITHRTDPDRGDFWIENAARKLSTQFPLIFYCEITYRDIFGKQRRTVACMQSVARTAALGGQEWVFAPKHNLVE